MTCQDNFPCLKLLSMLLFILHAMATHADDNHVHFHLNPLAGSGQANTNSGLTDVDNTIRIELLTNSKLQSDSAENKFRVRPLSDKLLETSQNSSLVFQVARPETSSNSKQMRMDSWDRSQMLRSIKDTALHLARQYDDNHKSKLMDDNLLPDEFVKLKLPYEGDEFRNRNSNFPTGWFMNPKLFDNAADSVPGFDETHFKSSVGGLLKDISRRQQRTRFSRDVRREEFLERNDFRNNEAFPGNVKPEIDFGIDLQNDDLMKWLEGLAEVEKYKNDGLHMPRDTSLEGPPEVDYRDLAAVLGSQPSDGETGEDPTQQDIGGSIINMAKIVLQQLEHIDESGSDDWDEKPNEVDKRNNPHKETIYKLIRQERPNRVRPSDRHERPSKDRSNVFTTPRKGFCQPETDGTQPMRCFSDKDRCLYDAMICDGTAQCPDAEDEAFPLCVLRHWTDRLMRKFLPS